MVPIRHLLNRNQLWRQFRDVQAEGFYRAADRIRLWSRILETKPFVTDSSSPGTAVEVHLLTYNRDYLSAIWALKSFYHYSQVSYPLVIHLQGRSRPRMLTRLKTHFPNASVTTQAEANSIAEQWLVARGFRRLAEARRASIMMMKLIDFLIIGQSVHVLALDSDVIFFRRPAELLVAGNKPLDLDLYMHDADSWYNISQSQAANELKIDLAPRVNCGVMLLARDDHRLERCEEYLAHPEVSRPNGLIEQTMHALYASEKRRVGYLPDSYYISPDQITPGLEQLVCRHYAGPSRLSLTNEGLPRLIQMGFLDQVRA